MMSLDRELARRAAANAPIRIGMVGAGVTGRMLAVHLLSPPVPGVRLVAIASRTPANAVDAFALAGIAARSVSSLTALEDHVERDVPVVSEDPHLLCEASNIDVVIEVTGTIDFGARIAMAAIRHRKHVVLVNAELDSTLGPILKVHADRAGVVVTNTDGDEPGVAMNLVRYVRMLGLRPVAAGNVKGLIDRYRTPETQQDFAARHRQNPVKVTSFADGTKLCMEAAILANATGFKVGQPGMYGPRCAHVKEMADLLPRDELLGGGLVDYALGAEPHTGAFVIVFEEHRRKRQELAYFKMGDGPFYVFYTPYHLPHVQVVSTIARAVLMADATVAPLGAPVCEVATCAKRDLKSGEVLDGVGGFLAYGVIDNAASFGANELLPMGLSEGCRLVRDIAKDAPVRWTDVDVPAGRLCDELWQEQGGRSSTAALATKR
jgi:predicted homoserine dehydrogenase-like protein